MAEQDCFDTDWGAMHSVDNVVSHPTLVPMLQEKTQAQVQETRATYAGSSKTRVGTPVMAQPGVASHVWMGSCLCEVPVAVRAPWQACGCDHFYFLQRSRTQA